MNITVIGTGYVGIVTAVVFADFGNQVRGLDIDPNRVKALTAGKVPIHEPRLEEFLQRGIQSQRLSFTTSYADALHDAEIIFICVGTPQSESGEVDLSYVKAAAASIAQHLKCEAIIVLKSTVPPGVHRELIKSIDPQIQVPYEFASVPEFLREGSAIADTLHPSRIVIGVQSQKTADQLLALHKPLPGERVVTDIISAQMIKYAANAFLATKISFANAIARLCDSLGGDVKDVMDGIGLDPRIGQTFLHPGLGFGGSCFPKDIKGIYHIAKKAGYDFDLIKVVDDINADQVQYLVDKMVRQIGDLKGKKVGLLGLAFKPDTDDMREARSVELIKLLQAQGAVIHAYDPVATKIARQVLGDSIVYADSVYQVAKNMDIMILVTEWNEFKEIDLKRVKGLMKGHWFVDGRNLYDPQTVKKVGLAYLGVGRHA